MNGMALPSWLLAPGTVLLRRHVRNKGDPFCDTVDLVEGNPTYSIVRLLDGRESSLSFRFGSVPSSSQRQRGHSEH